MIPALQPPNTGALSLRLSFLISFGTCYMRIPSCSGDGSTNITPIVANCNNHDRSVLRLS